MKLKLSGFFILTILMTGCLFEPPDEIVSETNIGTVNGMKPIYIQTDEWQNLSVEAARPIRELGKIYYKDAHIFVNESGNGIHVIDNTDPFNPRPIKFISIPGNADVAIKNNYLYADNLTDLVVFDIGDLNDIKFVNRIENLYPRETENLFPPDFFGFFECAEPDKGTIIRWEEAILENPGCSR